MGLEFENKVVNIFYADLKLIKEWIQKPIEQIEVSLKAKVEIKELNEMVNDDLEYANYRKKTTVLDDESENNDMDVSEDGTECIETFFGNGVKKR